MVPVGWKVGVLRVEDVAIGVVTGVQGISWTELTITGIKPVSGELDAGMEPNFSAAATGTVIYWDDMAIAGP